MLDHHEIFTQFFLDPEVIFSLQFHIPCLLMIQQRSLLLHI